MPGCQRTETTSHVSNCFYSNSNLHTGVPRALVGGWYVKQCAEACNLRGSHCTGFVVALNRDTGTTSCSHQTGVDVVGVDDSADPDRGGVWGYLVYRRGDCFVI